MKNVIVTTLLALLLPIYAWAEKPIAPQHIDGIERINAEQVIELILNTPSLVVIDSRKSEEYAKGHIQGAISLLDTSMTKAGLSRYVADKTTPLLFYCNGARCLRSSNAARKARDWGYRHIYWFRGGWVEWTEKKLPVSK